MNYVKIPILEAAERCGLNINKRTIGYTEVEAYCPFCEGSSYHLYLNTDINQFNCQKCKEKGNSVSLYAKVMGIDNKSAFEQLTEGRVYKIPQTHKKPVEAESYLAPLSIRHDVYYDMLSLLKLSYKHKQNLLERGLSEQRITDNCYRSMPGSWYERQRIAKKLSQSYDLRGVPGFFTYKGEWTLWGKAGILVPVCNKDGYIQGLQIRLNNVKKRKYRWLSSNPMYGYENGTRAYSWIHVTGNSSSKVAESNVCVACITEGGLKGDVASFLHKDALFVCVPGVSNIEFLPDVLRELNVTKLIGCYDMDMEVNNDVAIALEKMKAMIKKELALEYEPFRWNPKYNGIDDFLYARQQFKQAA